MRHGVFTHWGRGLLCRSHQLLHRFNSRHEVFGYLFRSRYKAVLVDGGSGDYFRVVGTCKHLNPARARWIRVGEEPLRSDAWSSYPTYVGRGKGRPRWMETARVLRCAGLGLWNGGGVAGDARDEGRAGGDARRAARWAGGVAEAGWRQRGHSQSPRVRDGPSRLSSPDIVLSGILINLSILSKPDAELLPPPVQRRLCRLGDGSIVGARHRILLCCQRGCAPASRLRWSVRRGRRCALGH